MLASCAGNSAEKTDSSDNDTIVTDTVPVVKPPKSLPDTVYPSAEVVKFKIDRRDSTPGDVAPLVDLYADAPGVFTFRGGMHRRADFNGRVDSVPSRIDIDWEFTTAVDNRQTSVGTWGGGTGWTGQPLYVNWPDSTWKHLRDHNSVYPNAGREEIIVGSLDSHVYFIDYQTGEASRQSISVGNPIKGTVSLDPTLNGNLYVGHGVPAQSPFGAVAIDLFSNIVSDVFDRDPRAQRSWGAYDSSSLRYGQFLFRPGENGTFYKFIVAPGKLTLHSALRYTVGGSAPGIESSMAIYANYGYIADNAGNIIAVNLNTMRPVWRYSLGDDVDASLVLEVEDDVPYIYVGCEVDRQGTGTANMVKLDARDGREVWLTRIPARRADINGKHFDGGFYGTVLPGTGDCSDRVFANCVLNNENRQNGVFVAFSRADGHILYQTPLKYYAWSSPVGYLTPDGRLTVLTADCAGNMYLIDPKDGKIIFTKPVGANFESSPVAIGNTAVVGSRGNKIYRVSLH